VLSWNATFASSENLLPKTEGENQLLKYKRLGHALLWILSQSARYVGVSQLVFLIGHPYLIGLWSGEDQVTITIKTHVYKRLDHIFNLY
jgi:hypothetical protein